MGDFEAKDYWKLYLNKESKERVREIQDHLEEKYDSRSQFLQEKLKEEQALDIEERIRREKQELESKKEKIERLETIKEERNVQDKLRDKRKLLKQTQKKLKEVQENGLKSKKEIVEEEVEKRSQYDVSRQDDIVQRAVEKRLEDRPDVDELVEDVQRLQRQVAELNGGEEDYFMDLGDVEVAELESA